MALGPSRVELDLGGALHLTVRSWLSLVDPTIVVCYADGQEVSLRPARDDGTLHVEGLRCGSHLLEIRRGPKWLRGLTYASEKFSVQSGRTTSLVIQPSLAELRENVDLCGTLLIEGRWPDAYSRLVFINVRGYDEGTRGVVASIGLRDVPNGVPVAFTSNSVQPSGLYHVRVMPYGYQGTVRFDGRSKPQIHISDAAVLAIQVESTDGREIGGARVLWRTIPRDGSDRGGSLQRAEFDQTRRAFLLRVPPGRIKVHVSASGYRQVGHRLFDITAGEDQDRVIKMARAATLIVRVRQGEQPIGAEIEPCRAPRDVGPTRETSREGVATFRDLPAGDYTIYARVPVGYVEPKPRRLSLREGETVRVEFSVQASVR